MVPLLAANTDSLWRQDPWVPEKNCAGHTAATPNMPSLAPLSFLLFLLLTGCSGGEIVGLHIALQPDGSATVTARALVESPTPSPAEVLAKNVTWGKRAALVYTQGAVTKISEFTFGDESLQFVQRLDPTRLTVRIQRGDSAGWVKALVPDRQRRRDLALVYDPLGKTKELGDTLRIEFVLPTKVNASDAQPAARGVSYGKEGNRAFLSIPVETALEKGEPLTWDITWN